MSGIIGQFGGLDAARPAADVDVFQPDFEPKVRSRRFPSLSGGEMWTA